MDYKFFLGIGVAVAIVLPRAAICTGLVKHAPANSPERDTLYGSDHRCADAGRI